MNVATLELPPAYPANDNAGAPSNVFDLASAREQRDLRAVRDRHGALLGDLASLAAVVTTLAPVIQRALKIPGVDEHMIADARGCLLMHVHLMGRRLRAQKVYARVLAEAAE